ncbi:RNA pseudouridine synthase 3, mitochondrial isoform X2 [Cajanus cajan]|uniref:RNA pseudouridine synthase 3, mitochondrial isoform X2 n=1 Tax=Cajanus cajan TaxID=3821 RepID=UPI00098DC377|nr:RNA pseudouridine synthase 3, mitochondrial isoform X2 [Cajanus cajan]
MEDFVADDSSTQKEELRKPMRKIRPNEVMKRGVRVHVPVSIAETRISKRYDAIPSGTLYPNADEIKYLQRLLIYKAWLSLNIISILYYSFLLVFLLLNCMEIYFVHYILCSNVLLLSAAIIVLNKPPKLPVKGNLPVHNSMDALVAAALSYDYDEGPKLVLLNDGFLCTLFHILHTPTPVDHKITITYKIYCNCKNRG